MEKLTYIESDKNYISINYHILRGCNFKCDYCCDKDSRDGKGISSKNDFLDFITFTQDLDLLHTQTKIEITLIGGEPLLHKDIFFLIDKLYELESKNENTYKIIIATNGFLINNFSDELLKYSGSDFLQLNISYHYVENQKYDLNKKRFFSIMDFLKKHNIKFNLIFLLPTKLKEFEETKDMINKLDLDKNILTLDLIRFGGEVTDYDQDILDYYDDFYLDIDNKKYLKTTINGTQEILSNTQLFNRKLNRFKGYKCYPFRKNTFINVFPNLDVFFAGCNTLYNKKYDLKEVIDIFSDKKNEENFVYCIDEVCDCCSAYGIKKSYDNKNIKLSNILREKLKNHLNIEGLKYLNTDYLNNSLDLNKIEISFSYDQKVIVFVVEQRDFYKQYMYHDQKLGIHWYTKNFMGEFEKYNFPDTNIFENIVELIKKYFVVFELIIEKGKKQ